MKQKLIERVKQILFTFVCVTTCMIFANALFITMYYDINEVKISAFSYWIILGISMLTSLGNLLYPFHEVSRKRFFIIKCFHFIYVCIVVLGFGFINGWYDFTNIPMVFGMFGLIVVIFIIVYIAVSIRDKRIADQMNKKLEQFQEDEEQN